MARNKTELEIQKLAILKAYRTNVRLKYALMADREIAQNEPELLERIDSALAEGHGIEFDPASVLREIEA